MSGIGPDWADSFNDMDGNEDAALALAEILRLAKQAGGTLSPGDVAIVTYIAPLLKKLLKEDSGI